MKKIICIVPIFACVVSCSSGTTSSNSGSNIPNWNPPAAESGPSGPISYQYIIDSYYAINKQIPQSHNTIVKTLKSALNPTCGLADSSVGVVTGAFSFLPDVGGVFGGISEVAGFIGGLGGSSCTTQQLNAINANLNYQESQILSLQVGSSYFENQFAQDNYILATEAETIAGFSFNQSLAYFIGNNDGNKGLFQNLMIDGGFWSENGTAYNISPSMIGLTQLINLNPSATAQEEFQQNLSNLSGAGYSDCDINCYAKMNTNKNTALFLTLNSLYTQLLAQLQVINNTQTLPTNNVTSYIDGYNNTLNGIFVQAVVALQEAYAIEFLVNLSNFEYINNNFYVSGITNPPISKIFQSNSYSNAPGTYFSYLDLYYSIGGYPSVAQTELAYNKAQEQLTLAYAAAINQLYQTILSYTLTDNTIGTETYPSKGVVYRTLPNNMVESYSYTIPYNLANTAAITSIGNLQTPLALLGLESINILGYQSNVQPGYMIYQYDINNVSQCVSSLARYNSNNSSESSFIVFAQAVENNQYQCDPALGVSYNGTYVPGQQLSFYWADQTVHAPIASLGVEWNNLSNTPTTFVGNIYNINNYSLNIVYDNQPGVYYLVNGTYNQPESSAVGANVSSAWTQLGSTQYFTNSSLTGNLNYNTNYIQFIPTVYSTVNTDSTTLLTTLMSTSSSIHGSYPGVLTALNTSTTPNNTFFNPLGVGIYPPTECGDANNVIYYVLPDGTPLPLNIYVGFSSCTNNIPAYAQLFYSATNYPTVSCNPSSSICTTPNGNSYQLNFTTSTNQISLSASMVN